VWILSVDEEEALFVDSVDFSFLKIRRLSLIEVVPEEGV
jgi:hypothetical protein